MGVGDPALCLFEGSDEFFSDYFSFVFGVSDSLKCFEESLGGTFMY